MAFCCLWREQIHVYRSMSKLLHFSFIFWNNLDRIRLRAWHLPLAMQTWIMPSCVWANTKKSQRHIPIFYLFVSCSLMCCFQKAINTWDVVHLKMHCIVGGSFFIEACEKKALWSQYCSSTASSPPNWIIKWICMIASIDEACMQKWGQCKWKYLERSAEWHWFFFNKKYITCIVIQCF